MEKETEGKTVERLVSLSGTFPLLLSLFLGWLLSSFTSYPRSVCSSVSLVSLRSSPYTTERSEDG